MLTLVSLRLAARTSVVSPLPKFNGVVTTKSTPRVVVSNSLVKKRTEAKLLASFTPSARSAAMSSSVNGNVELWAIRFSTSTL